MCGALRRRSRHGRYRLCLWCIRPATAVLATLTALGRPAAAAELATLLGADPLAVRLVLCGLRKRRLARENKASSSGDDYAGSWASNWAETRWEVVP